MVPTKPQAVLHVAIFIFGCVSTRQNIGTRTTKSGNSKNADVAVEISMLCHV
jgi:hypothetical protein